MTKILKPLMLTIMVVMAFSGLAQAQQVQAEKIPVKVQIVISKYENDRKTSSLPYAMFITANGDKAMINVGSNVPIATAATGSFTYTSMSTSFDCTVTTESGRFKVYLNLNDNYLIAPAGTSASDSIKRYDPQTYGKFSYAGSVTMKEGETKQIISAADRTTGEVVKVDVTLTLDK